MESKVIKIAPENYRWLVRLAGDLQKKAERPVSIDEALKSLKPRMDNRELLSYAGMWKDKPESIYEDIRKGWKSWKIKFV